MIPPHDVLHEIQDLRAKIYHMLVQQCHTVRAVFLISAQLQCDIDFTQELYIKWVKRRCIWKYFQTKPQQKHCEPFVSKLLNKSFEGMIQRLH